MTTFQTIEDLKNMTSQPSNTETYMVEGYALPGDGGGGSFHWNPTSVASDDGGLVIKALAFATGRFERNYDPASGPVDLRWFGIRYNDSTSAAGNYSRLVPLINQGHDILLTDLLFLTLNAVYNTVTADTINISGNSATAGFQFTNSGTMFVLPARLQLFSLNSLSLVFPYVEKSNPVYLFEEKIKACFIEQLQITNCTFNGAFSTRIYGAGFALGTAGAGTALISNNEIRNSHNGWMTFTDCVYEEFTIRDNQLYDIYENFFNDGITNGIAGGDDIRLNKKQLNVQHNTLINAPATIKTGGNNSYYVFVLTEANSCLYEYNHVEGIKATNSVAIYDIYMSSETGIYRNNVYKNNLCFGSVTDGAKAMFKGKAGSSKVIENSKFIIEEAFVTDFLSDHADMNLNPDNTWVAYASFDTEAVKNSSIRFTGNEFDAYFMRNMVFANKEFSHYEVRNNSFRFNRIVGPFLSADNSTVSTPKKVRRFIFDENTVTRYGNSPIGTDTAVIQGRSAPGAIDPAKDEMQLSIQNNVFSGWNGSVLTTIAADGLVLYNNTFDAPTPSPNSTTFCAATYLDSVSGSLNTFTTTGYNPSDLRIGSYFKNSDVTFSYDITGGKLLASTGMCMMPVSYNKTYTRQYELSSALYGAISFSYTVTGTRDPATGNNYLSYRDFVNGKDHQVLMANPTVLGSGSSSSQVVYNVMTANNVLVGTLKLYVVGTTVVLSFVLAGNENHTLKIRQLDTVTP